MPDGTDAAAFDAMIATAANEPPRGDPAKGDDVNLAAMDDGRSHDGAPCFDRVGCDRVGARPTIPCPRGQGRNSVEPQIRARCGITAGALEDPSVTDVNGEACALIQVENRPSATASPQGDMISVQPMFSSPSRSTAAGQANA